MMKKVMYLLTLLLSISLFGCTTDIGSTTTQTIKTTTTEQINETTTENSQITETTTTTIEVVETTTTNDPVIDEDGYYTSKDDVALYLYTYGVLPNNLFTKGEAKDLGWVASKGNLWDVTDHKSIGGDHFYNREGLLPKASGRYYYECDINYNGGYRGAQRIVFSNDGLIFYTGDHYESFTLLYGND